MSLKHAILGFLSYRSLSGYDLKKAFDRSVQHFWPANQSQIYRTLAEMKDEGLVEHEVIVREERLDMKVYHITPAGTQELHRWLSEPIHPTDYREPFLIQLYFGGTMSDEELIEVLKYRLKQIEERLAVFLSVYPAYQEKLKTHEDKRAYFLNIATLEYGIHNGFSFLEWYRNMISRLESKNYTLEDFQQE
jgi:DNA-binding PadR family transcriptional regulator